MMLPDIQQSHLREVMDLHQELTEVKYYKEKRRRFSLLVSGLSPEAHWLLTFFCWFCLFNFRFKKFDESRFYSVPVAKDSSSDFKGFINVIRYFNRKSITNHCEAILLKFLVACDQEQQDFWMEVLSKRFVKALPLLDVQSELDLDLISVQDVYGPIELLQTGFEGLTYPVAVTALSTPEVPLQIFCREPHKKRSLELHGSELVAIPSVLKQDHRYVKTPRYTLIGFGADTSFYPVDYFETWADYSAYRAGTEVPFHSRIDNLRKFISSNLLVEVSQNYIGFATTKDEIIPEIIKVMENSSDRHLCISDQKTASTGKALTVEARVAKGLIDSYWIEDSEVKGYNLWFNGKLFPCSFSFCGLNNSLLNSIALVKGKLLKFLYIKVGDYRAGVGREILHHEKPWRNGKLKGGIIRVEKCAFCGGTGSRHESRGVCKNCEGILYRYYQWYGPDVWIKQTPDLKRRRGRAVWEPTLLTNVQYRFKGHYLEAAENGDWRFATHPDAIKQYEQQREKYSMKK